MGIKTNENSLSVALLRNNRRHSLIESRQAKNYDHVRKSIQQAIVKRENEIAGTEGVICGADNFELNIMSFPYTYYIRINYKFRICNK